MGVTFEADGAVRDPRGLQHGMKDGALFTFVDGLVAGGAWFGVGLEVQRGGSADDFRQDAARSSTRWCARGGGTVSPQAGLMMFERGGHGALACRAAVRGPRGV